MAAVDVLLSVVLSASHEWRGWRWSSTMVGPAGLIPNRYDDWAGWQLGCGLGKPPSYFFLFHLFLFFFCFLFWIQTWVWIFFCRFKLRSSSETYPGYALA
jgi:hypothetical protein